VYACAQRFVRQYQTFFKVFDLLGTKRRPISLQFPLEPQSDLFVCFTASSTRRRLNGTDASAAALNTAVCNASGNHRVYSTHDEEKNGDNIKRVVHI
jgi:hypothetical protein